MANGTGLHRYLFDQYRRVYRYSQWFRRRFTPMGHLLLGLLVASAVFGVNTKLSDNAQVFGFLLALLALAWLLQPRKRLQLRIRRELPRYLGAGETGHYLLHLENRLPRRYHSLALGDCLHEVLPQPGFSNRRFPTYRQWLQRLAWLRGANIAEMPLSPLAQATVTLQVPITPLRRGKLQFNGCQVAQCDWFGLWQRRQFFPLPETCWVLPQRYPVKPLLLAGKRQYQRGGVNLASSVGDSTEFLGLRDYRNGDPLRHIHWKSLAKTGQWVSKEFQDEYFMRQALVLDTFTAGFDDARFEAAVSVAASLLFAQHPHDSLLDLLFVGHEVHCFSAGRGLDHTPHLLEILAAVQANADGDFAQLRQAVLARLKSCSSLLCVLLHWDGERQALLQRLQGEGLPFLALVLHDGVAPSLPLGAANARFHAIDYREVAAGLAAL